MPVSLSVSVSLSPLLVPRVSTFNFKLFSLLLSLLPLGGFLQNRQNSGGCGGKRGGGVIFGSSSRCFLSQEPKMSLRKGSKVWAEDRDLAWVPAEAIEFVGKQVRVLTASGKKVKILFFSEDVFSNGIVKFVWFLDLLS